MFSSATDSAHLLVKILTLQVLIYLICKNWYKCMVNAKEVVLQSKAKDKIHLHHAVVSLLQSLPSLFLLFAVLAIVSPCYTDSG